MLPWRFSLHFGLVETSAHAEIEVCPPRGLGLWDPKAERLEPCGASRTEVETSLSRQGKDAVDADGRIGAHEDQVSHLEGALVSLDRKRCARAEADASIGSKELLGFDPVLQ
jgi:hypothetical protein